MLGNHNTRATELKVLYDHKRKITDLVRGRFARYGQEVVTIVLTHSFQPSRLARLIQRVGLKPSNDLMTNLDGLMRLLADSGPSKFIKRVNNDSKKALGPGSQGKIPESRISLDLMNGMNRIIQNPKYTGTERRISSDRRLKSTLRRRRCAAVLRNRRYGTDRRNLSRGRRSSDK